MIKERKWYYLMPLAGVIFGIWFVRIASYDVVYSDYIRLVNSYLPGVWDPSKFFVPDVLTRVPATYLGRIINTTFFHYSLTFDQVMGVLGMGVSSAVLMAYCIQKKIGPVWAVIMMMVSFSLNKWEMMVNGSGWIHFWAFAGFYYHYMVLDRVLTGTAKPHDGVKLCFLPWLLILCVAGQYCAVYTAVLLLIYGGKLIRDRVCEKKWKKEYIVYTVHLLIPFGLYLLSNSYGGGGGGGSSLIAQLLDTPGYFVRFMLKSLASAVVGVDYAQSHFSTNLPYNVIGLLVAAAYLLALWLQYRYRIYEKAVLPLIFIISGAANHFLIMLARWSFLKEDYGMSSRYAIQFQLGVLGILMTFAYAWNVYSRKERVRRAVGRLAMLACTCMFLAGAVNDTHEELGIAPFRRILCQNRAQIALDFENRTDDELRENFEYDTSNPDAGRAVRNALTILKDNGWNVFHNAQTGGQE